MLNCKLLLICVNFLIYHVSCDDYKNWGFRLRPDETLHRELTKNQFDHVQIIEENMPRITKNLLREFGAVKKLEIEHSQVRTIEEGSFSRMTIMKKLSLKHNLLEEIRNGVFAHLQIEELDLSDNLIKVIEGNAFDYMSELRSIKLKNNKIETYNNQWFIHVPNLCSINFENNLIRVLPSEIIGNPSYRGCLLDAILSHNIIEKIDENAFKGAFDFNRLYLDHNAITTLPKVMFFEIKELRLDYNKIVCTTPKWRHNIKNYTVSHNPWNPECLEAFKNGKEYPAATTTSSTTTTTELPTKLSSTTPKIIRYIRFG